MATRGSGRIAAFSGIIALLLAACGDGETTDGADAEDGQAEEAGEPVELVVWAGSDWHMPPDVFAGLTEQYPNITVTTDLKPDDDSLQQMQARRDVGDRLPDLVFDDSFLLESYHAAELIAPLDEWKERWEEEEPEVFANILPTAWDENVIDGDTMSVTLSSNMDVIFYNVPWFEEAGIDAEAIDSLDGLLEALRTLQSTRPDQIPFSLKALPTEGVTAQKAFMSAAGAPFEGAVPDLESPGGLYVIDWFIQAANEDMLPAEAIAWADQEAQGAFFAGRAGIIIDGFHTAADYRDEPDFDYGEDWALIPIPTSRSGAEQDGHNINQAKTWMMSADSENPYEASLALRYINETIVDQALNGGYVPRNTEALEDPELLEGWAYFTDTFKEAYLSSEPQPTGLAAGSVELILEELFGEIVTGTDETAEELAAKYQEQLDGL